MKKKNFLNKKLNEFTAIFHFIFSGNVTLDRNQTIENQKYHKSFLSDE